MVVGVTASATLGYAADCSRSDFESVVDEAAAALRDLNLKNRPIFQDKLRALRDKRGWSYDEFMKGAVPFVKDEKIEVYDRTSNEMLAELSTLGQEGAEAATPDCKLLDELKARMKTLIDTQSTKWAYMFGKLDTELKR